MGNEIEPLVIHDLPQLSGEPIEGICEGRIVAYWPSDNDQAAGLRAVGCGGYIPAMLVACWHQRGFPVVSPCANIRLFTDGVNIPVDAITKAGGNRDSLGSRQFSLKPAKGCWTWLPKA